MQERNVTIPSGDAVLAEFASVVDAVQGAVAIQKDIKTRNADLPTERRMVFRIGINLGDLVVDGDRIYGDGVNLAARLEALADPGGICISRTAYDQIEDKLPLGYEYLGEKTVKNAVKPLRAYKVLFNSELERQSIKQDQSSKRSKFFSHADAVSQPVRQPGCLVARAVAFAFVERAHDVIDLAGRCADRGCFQCELLAALDRVPDLALFFVRFAEHPGPGDIGLVVMHGATAVHQDDAVLNQRLWLSRAVRVRTRFIQEHA